MNAEHMKVLREMAATLRRIEGLLAVDEVGVTSLCPFCGSGAIENTTTMDEEPRATCLRCGKSFRPDEVVSNG